MEQRRPRILIIDDDPSTVHFVAGVLRDEYELSIALGGTQGVDAALREPRPELILLDVMMPGEDGFEVCARLKGVPETRDLPVIFITACDRSEDEEHGLRVGAVDFITKPIRAATLKARIRTHLALKLQTDRIAASESLLKATLDSTRDGILVVAQDGRVVMSNRRFQEMWRIPSAVIESRDEHELLAVVLDQLSDPEGFRAQVRALYESDREASDLLQFRDGRIFSRHSLPLMQDGVGKGRVWSFTDVTEEKRLEAQLRRLSVTDPLTGLFNRRRMDELLWEEFNRCERYDYDFALLLLDLDHFKAINDGLGHAKGDLVLQRFSVLLEQEFRDTDLCCRYGGEEFCVIMPYVTEAMATQAAERFRRSVEGEEIGGVSLTVSIGIALHSQLPAVADARQLIKSADRALYAAKREGRNRVVCYGEGLGG